MKERFMRFMSGRYGTDDFSKFILGASLVLMVLNLFLRFRFLNTVILLLLVYVYFRMFSKNIQKRYQENAKYLQAKERVASVFQKEKRIAQEMCIRDRVYTDTCLASRQSLQIMRWATSSLKALMITQRWSLEERYL